ncbi:hypothetical protein GCM10010218_12510 [Streptomyces mashuensis]|uniref:Uncharacterized protein n=1 Tax=Streptomyces mashuensis TaxID=33904 RepID=A0A919AYU4_9ACTN|nr:hypothetical protein [Streptomyces mashuensis]GHF32943.1 hypothetical protein GCM10010218_12510 [Streptomyces mashuensis]
MTTKTFTISPRFDMDQHILGWGEGWVEHMRLIGGRLYYFTRGFTAEGYTTNRACIREPSTEWGVLPSWRLVHEFNLA